MFQFPERLRLDLADAFAGYFSDTLCRSIIPPNSLLTVRRSTRSTFQRRLDSSKASARLASVDKDNGVGASMARSRSDQGLHCPVARLPKTCILVSAGKWACRISSTVALSMSVNARRAVISKAFPTAALGARVPRQERQEWLVQLAKPSLRHRCAR